MVRSTVLFDTLQKQKSKFGRARVKLFPFPKQKKVTEGDRIRKYSILIDIPVVHKHIIDRHRRSEAARCYIRSAGTRKTAYTRYHIHYARTRTATLPGSPFAPEYM